MWKYVVKRFFLMIPTLLGVAVLIFLLMRVVPGDIVELRLAGDSGAVSEELLKSERARFGLIQRPEPQPAASGLRGSDCQITSVG